MKDAIVFLRAGRCWPLAHELAVTDLLSERQQLAYIAGQAADARLNVSSRPRA